MRLIQRHFSNKFLTIPPQATARISLLTYIFKGRIQRPKISERNYTILGRVDEWFGNRIEARPRIYMPKRECFRLAERAKKVDLRGFQSQVGNVKREALPFAIACSLTPDLPNVAERVKCSCASYNLVLRSFGWKFLEPLLPSTEEIVMRRCGLGVRDET